MGVGATEIFRSAQRDTGSQKTSREEKPIRTRMPDHLLLLRNCSKMSQKVAAAARRVHHGGCLHGGVGIFRKFKLMYILDCNDSGMTRLTTWDLATGEMQNEVQIVKERDTKKADIYIQMVLDHKEELLIAFHKGLLLFGSATSLEGRARFVQSWFHDKSPKL